MKFANNSQDFSQLFALVVVAVVVACAAQAAIGHAKLWAIFVRSAAA